MISSVVMTVLGTYLVIVIDSQNRRKYKKYLVDDIEGSEN